MNAKICMLLLVVACTASVATALSCRCKSYAPLYLFFLQFIVLCISCFKWAFLVMQLAGLAATCHAVSRIVPLDTVEVTLVSAADAAMVQDLFGR